MVKKKKKVLTFSLLHKVKKSLRKEILSSPHWKIRVVREITPWSTMMWWKFGYFTFQVHPQEMRVKRIQRQQVHLHHHFLGYLSATQMDEQSLCLAVTSQHCSFYCSLGFRCGCHLPPSSLGRPLSASKSFCIRLLPTSHPSDLISSLTALLTSTCGKVTITSVDIPNSCCQHP